MKNVSLFYDVAFTLLFATLSQLLFNTWVVDQYISMKDFGINESLSEICMYLTTCLDSCFAYSDSPSSHLISSNCIEMTKLQFFIACFDNSIYLRLLFVLSLLSLLFIFN